MIAEVATRADIGTIAVLILLMFISSVICLVFEISVAIHDAKREILKEILKAIEERKK